MISDAVAVVFQYFIQGVEPAIMHIGRRKSNIPKLGHPELAVVNSAACNGAAPVISVCCIQPDIAEFNAGGGAMVDQVMATVAIVFTEEQSHSAQFGGRKLSCPCHVSIKA